MPSTFGHIYFAELVYQMLNQIFKLDYNLFLIGNLVPDLAIDKKQSHYRKLSSVDGFWVPDLELAQKDLLVPTDSVKLGMYCHLYCDKYFITEYLIPSFIWDSEKQTVLNPKNNKTWDKSTFFSDKGIYGAYSEISPLLIRDKHVSLQKLEPLPQTLPPTGIPVYDTRKNKAWNAEIKAYYNNKSKNYTGNIINYNNFCKFIEQLSKKFVNELLMERATN